jgi:hypothetical protein
MESACDCFDSSHFALPNYEDFPPERAKLLLLVPEPLYVALELWQPV